MGDKYDRSGIYRITIDGKTVYVGKSIYITDRIATHIGCIYKSTEKKYEILREACETGHHIKYDLVCECPVEELEKKEDEWIAYYANQNLLLNTYYPNGRGGHYKSPWIRHLTLKDFIGGND